MVNFGRPVLIVHRRAGLMVPREAPQRRKDRDPPRLLRATARLPPPSRGFEARLARAAMELLPVLIRRRGTRAHRRPPGYPSARPWAQPCFPPPGPFDAQPH